MVKTVDNIKYGGKWKFLNNDMEFNGELIINDSEGVIRLVIYYVDKDMFDLFAKNVIPETSKIINGTLTNSAKISLLDCSVRKRRSHNIAYNTIIIDAKYAVYGMNFANESEAVFYKIDFKVSNIIGWSNLSGFDFPFLEGFSSAITYKFKGNVEYKINEEVTVSLLPRLGNLNLDCNVENITFSQSVLISISHANPQRIEKSVEILNKVLGLISLGIGERPDILKVEGYNSANYYLAGKNNTKIEQAMQIFFDNKYKEKYKESDIFYYLFTLSDLTTGEENLLTNWFSKHELLEPIIELYLSTLNYSNMSIERHFLTLVQALETYHMRFVCNKLPQYLERIEKITGKLPDKEQYLNELNDETQRSQDYILIKSRLIDLIIVEFKIWFYFGSRNEQFDFIKKVVDTRHYHTHYAINKKDKALTGIELEEACCVLQLILEYYLLTEIGLSFEHIQKKIKNKEANIRHAFDITRKSMSIDMDNNNKCDINIKGADVLSASE